MKYDLSKKPTKFAKRALKEFAQTLFLTLREKRLESITVNELCEKANYPRATFYNYFDDIYDLLEYSWHRIAHDMVVDDYASIAPQEKIYVLFERSYDYFAGYRDAISDIMKRNPEDGAFTESLRRAIQKQTYETIVSCPLSETYQLPNELMAEYYANTVQMVLSWCFLRKDQMDKNDALDALHYLLGGVQ